MKDYFADLMSENIWRCLGTYDDRKGEYNLTTSKKYTKPNSCINIAPGEYKPDNIVIAPIVKNITKNIINVLLKSFNPNTPWFE